MWRPRGGTLDFKWQGWSNVGKTQNPENSLGLPTKPNTITGAKKTFEIECLCLFLHHTIWSYHTRALPRILRLFWWPPKNPYLNQATQKNPSLNQAPQKNTWQIFQPKKISEMKISNPKKSFDYPCHLKSGAPSHWLLLIQRRQHFKSSHNAVSRKWIEAPPFLSPLKTPYKDV